MTPKILLLILFSVTLSAVAQIALKFGVSKVEAMRPAADPMGLLSTLLAYGGNGYVLLGLLTYGVGAVVWLLVLARLDVSQAYPYVGLGFIVTMILGILLLQESVTLPRVIGTLLVVAGVSLVARS